MDILRTPPHNSPVDGHLGGDGEADTPLKRHCNLYCGSGLRSHLATDQRPETVEDLLKQIQTGNQMPLHRKLEHLGENIESIFDDKGTSEGIGKIVGN